MSMVANALAKCVKTDKRPDRVVDVMRAWMLSFLFLLPAAAAETGGDPLYLTLEDGCYEMCGGQFDYFWTEAPSGTPGKAPLTVATPAYSPYHANVDLHPPEGRALRFTGPGELHISVGCEVADPGLEQTFEWDIRLFAGEARESFGEALPQPCLGDVQTIAFPIDLANGTVLPDDRLHMSVSAATVNPQIGSTANLYLVADDPETPTAIKAPWQWMEVEVNTTLTPVGAEDEAAPVGGSVQDEKAPLPPLLALLALLAAVHGRRR